MLGEIGGFGGGNALADHIGGLGRRQLQFPDPVVGFAAEEFRKIICRDSGRGVSGGGRGRRSKLRLYGYVRDRRRRDAASRVSTEIVRIESALAEDVGSADHSV